ncbi:hypothetical protein PQX77_019044 [Marasmius sp. AFHP31]|nr:hypothetical protein PQX77_019044 [Marasmius sp. AFHP31]
MASKLVWKEEFNISLGDSTPDNRIVAVAFSPDARFLAIGFPFLIQVWDLQKLDMEPASPRLSYTVRRGVVSLAWLRSEYLVHGSRNGRVSISAVEGLALESKQLQGGPDGDVSSIAFLGEGRIMAVGVGDSVQFWQISSLQYEWRHLGSLPRPPHVDQLSLRDLPVTSIFAVDNSSILVAYAHSAVILWRLTSMDPVQTTTPTGFRIRGAVTDFCPKSRSFLVADTDDKKYVWHDVYNSMNSKVYRPQSSLLQRPLVVTAARFLSEEVIVGNCAERLMLWDSEGKRLQSIQGDGLGDIETFNLLYDAEGDVGYLAIGGSDDTSSCLRLWRTVAVEDESVNTNARRVMQTRFISMVFLVLFAAVVGASWLGDSRFLDIEAELSSENEYADEDDNRLNTEDDNDFIDDTIHTGDHFGPPPRFSPDEPDLDSWRTLFRDRLTPDRVVEKSAGNNHLVPLADPREGDTEDQLVHILRRTCPELLRHENERAFDTLTVPPESQRKRRLNSSDPCSNSGEDPSVPSNSKRKKTLADTSASAAPFGTFFARKRPSTIKKTWTKWAAGHPVAPDSTVPRRQLAPGEWVEVCTGRYKGDGGIVWRPDTTRSGATGYFILVVPRLRFPKVESQHDETVTSNDLALSLARPPPRLFLAENFEQGVEQESDHTFRFQRKTFSHGLLIKFFRDISLAPTRTLPSDLGELFLRSEHPFLRSFPLPLPEFFVFLAGDLVYLPEDGRTGVIEQNNGMNCVIDFGDDEKHIRAVELLQKVVVPGDSIRVMAGEHSGREGLVVERHASVLHIFCRDDTRSRTAFFVHINSVKICRLTFDSHDDTPWLNLDVLIVHGRYFEMRASVKAVRLTPLRDRIKLSVYLTELSCSLDLDLDEVVEAVTRKPLLDYQPLKESQRSRFKIDESMVRMRTGRVPWLGMRVRVTGGLHKGKIGVVRDVNRSSRQSSDSGLEVSVELQVVSGGACSRTEKIEYAVVREIDSGLELARALPLTSSQDFYKPAPTKRGGAHSVPRHNQASLAAVHSVSSPSSTPVHVSEYEDLDWDNISDPWNPYSVSPIWSSPDAVPPSSSPASPEHVSSPNALVVPSFSRRREPVRSLPPAPSHWILHPNLLGVPIRVTITRGKWKKKSVFVTPTSTENGTKLLLRQKDILHAIDLPSIGKCCDRPKPNFEQSLMVVTAGDDQHIGKFVRRISYFYDQVKSDNARWFIAGVVDRSGRQDRLTGELLELPPTALEIVEESKDDRDVGNALFESVRYAAKVGKPEVR